MADGFVTLHIGDNNGPGPIPGLWSTKSPKQNTLKVVKLTESNLRQVAGELLKTGEAVQVDDEEVTLGLGYRTFSKGDYVVEEWDYDAHRNKYRLATRAERIEYDLR